MEAVYKRRLRRRGEDGWYKMKKNRIISGVILFISAAAILLYGTGPVIGLVKKLGYLGEDGKILMRLEDENISASVQKSFTVPLGGEGMILVEYIRKRGTADISITKNGQEVAGMGIERPEHMDGASSGLLCFGCRGKKSTVLRLWLPGPAHRTAINSRGFNTYKETAVKSRILCFKCRIQSPVPIRHNLSFLSAVNAKSIDV